MAHSYLASSMVAMGGEGKLRGIRAIEYRAVGSRTMVEQSERPTGPYFIDHFRLHEIRDFRLRRARIERADEAYAADKWWLDQTEPVASTTILNDNVAAVLSGGMYTYGGGSLVQQNLEQFAFAPERLLQTAAAAPDLRARQDVVLHGVRHHVVGFTWNGAPCALFINALTNLPWSLKWTRNYPYQTFLDAWGDVTSSVTYNSWALEPYGISYPREWTYVRLGLPDQQLSIVALKINPTLIEADLTVPKDIYAAHHNNVRLVNDVPLGLGGSGPPHALTAGILLYPGAWNVAFVKQDTGMVMIEAPWSTGYTQRAMSEAIKKYKLPITAVITTSDSWPHIAGVRQVVARGIPVYALDLNVPILQRLLRAPHRFVPDLLAEHPAAPNFRIVTHNTFLGSGENRLEIIPYHTATGERQMMIYFPSHQLLYTSDLFSGDGNGGWFTPEYVHEMIGSVQREHLAVKTIFGMHYDPTPYQTAIDYIHKFAEQPTVAPSPKAISQTAAEPLAALARFDGNWQCDGSFPATGKKISSSMSFESGLGGSAIVKHHDDRLPSTYHAIEAWEYDPNNHRYVDAITDNFGGLREFTSDGWRDGVLTWSSGPEVKPIQQFQYTQIRDGMMRVDWRVSRDGTRYTVGDTLECTKA